MRSIFTGAKMNAFLEVSIIVLVAGFSLLLFIIGLALIIPEERPRVKCPYCKNKQFDSSYSKQVCERCLKEWRVESDF